MLVRCHACMYLCGACAARADVRRSFITTTVRDESQVTPFAVVETGQCSRDQDRSRTHYNDVPNVDIRCSVGCQPRSVRWARYNDVPSVDIRCREQCLRFHAWQPCWVYCFAICCSVLCLHCCAGQDCFVLNFTIRCRAQCLLGTLL